MCPKAAFVYTSCTAIMNQEEDTVIKYLTPTTNILDILPELVIRDSFIKIPENTYLSSKREVHVTNLGKQLLRQSWK